MWELSSADQPSPLLGPIFKWPIPHFVLGVTVVGAAAATMGPWGEPELLVWRPEAVASEPPGPVGLEVKMGALVLLLLLTLLCSLVPICVLRRPGAGPEALGEPLLSLLPPQAWGREGSGAEDVHLKKGR